MSGLANLARLVEAATPGPWRVNESDGGLLALDGGSPNVFAPALDYHGGELFRAEIEWLGGSGDPALIAAAPDMAALLIECEEALLKLADAGHPNSTCNICVACRALSRLAGFDAQLGETTQ